MSLTLVTENVSTVCRLARQLELRGDYERAAGQLKPFWRGVGERPNTEGLASEEAAELLLRAGVATGWLGSSRQIAGAQSAARDLISEAERLYSDPLKVAECRNAQAVSYWREGDFKTAEIIARAAYEDCLPETEQRAALVNNIAMLEIQQGKLNSARIFLTANYDDVMKANSPHERSVFHSQFGYVYKKLGEESQEPSEREKLFDLALVEYDGACALLEKTGHWNFKARVQNSIAMVLTVKGVPHLAHPYIQGAIEFAKYAGDYSLLGSFEETRARVLLAEGKLRESLVAIKTSLGYLKEGEQWALQAESQTTCGTILARMGKRDEAEYAFREAIRLAETAHIDTVQIRLAYLREMMELHKDEAVKYEREWVQLALNTAGGHPSQAAKLAGVSHQNMINKIKRFDLVAARKPPQPRKKKVTMPPARKA